MRKENSFIYNKSNESVLIDGSALREAIRRKGMNLADASRKIARTETYIAQGTAAGKIGVMSAVAIQKILNIKAAVFVYDALVEIPFSGLMGLILSKRTGKSYENISESLGFDSGMLHTASKNGKISRFAATAIRVAYGMKVGCESIDTHDGDTKEITQTAQEQEEKITQEIYDCRERLKSALSKNPEPENKPNTNGINYEKITLAIADGIEKGFSKAAEQIANAISGAIDYEKLADAIFYGNEFAYYRTRRGGDPFMNPVADRMMKRYQEQEGANKAKTEEVKSK